MTNPLQDAIRTQLLAEAEDQDLPLTVTQVDILAAAATTAALSTFAPGSPATPSLSDEQIGVLVGLAVGESAERTGRRFSRSAQTVRSRRLSVYRALGVRTGPAAVAVAMTHGLLRIPSLSGRLPLPGQHPGGDA
ncbi:helix-turn-helix transcriptional regulator [Streptomyces cyaneofuscatus]|uniref:helix-turn-helix transcriptional regulator n=1 Tax=Streptomyces cyaneofuscatus TaxID=66883 RepID=UPI0033BF7A56